MSLNLIADRIVNGKIYPALAQTLDRDFDRHYPYTVPLRLLEYCVEHGVELNIIDIDSEWPADALYPVGLGFFDFSIDYFELMPERIRAGLFFGDVRVLFYYHEGDNPLRIKIRLDELCAKHNLRNNCYRFVSGNTAAKQLANFVYFTDFELWYYQRNQVSAPLKIRHQQREREFTVLNRLHKSWRALIMTDLMHLGILDNSYWSYCESGKFIDTDCPIKIGKFIYDSTEEFLKLAPYISDELDHDQRNDHSTLVPKYHVNSYCNIVMETHFDADQSGGTFLTEKTFKPIKHGQLFFIAGPAGSLQLLRKLGYRVFDGILDNSYDQEPDHTQRWLKLSKAICHAQEHLHELFNNALADIEHNQQLFQATKNNRLNSLIKEINESN
jgi:hypothetical protein